MVLSEIGRTFWASALYINRQDKIFGLGRRSIGGGEIAFGTLWLFTFRLLVLRFWILTQNRTLLQAQLWWGMARAFKRSRMGLWVIVFHKHTFQDPPTLGCKFGGFRLRLKLVDVICKFCRLWELRALWPYYRPLFKRNLVWPRGSLPRGVEWRRRSNTRKKSLLEGFHFILIFLGQRQSHFLLVTWLL